MSLMVFKVNLSPHQPKQYITCPISIQGKPEDVFKTFYFLRNLRMGPIS